MNNIVDVMIEYRKTGNSSLLISSNMEIDKENLNVIVIDLLSWLKLEYKRIIWISQGKKTCLKPMQLNMKYPWCIDLCELVKKEKIFNEIFCVKDNNIFFADEVTEEDRESIRKSAFDKYNPQKRS